MEKALIKRRRRIVKDLCRTFGIRYRIKNIRDAGGLAHIELNRITLDYRNPKSWSKQKSLSWFISVTLHEICHILAHRFNKYPVYHSPSIYFKDNNERLAYKRTALRAEQYVDRWAETLFKKLYPKRRYHRSYRSEDDKEFLRQYLKEL